MTDGRRPACETPSVSLKAAKRLWFTHDGTAYAVVSAPSSIFRAAVLARAPGWWHDETYGPLLAQSEMDLIARWFLLTELGSHSRGLVLYESREEAAG